MPFGFGKKKDAQAEAGDAAAAADRGQHRQQQRVAQALEREDLA